ncbi:AAA family ATPase [Pseudanabaena sp. FACHB-2040]|uniref:AAA family ATPase n=1 Tax=Pseudanabaena sp. FACHB-2040 TaxID=2692859 RepID=UPI001681E7B5|nr:AAA family ATPase [Pseudanabaena sp. FACHB-2040]MBD2261078.1 AAA family ATPase [Pseudanabaena sp. FACHB-2040]
MVFELRSIRLQNWRCYQNEHIKFAPNLDQKKIWIVFGNNGFGKTSLLDGIQWCLYGSSGVPTANLRDYFNRVALKSNPDLELSVQLTFERDGSIHEISRHARRLVKGTAISAQVSEAHYRIDGIEQGDSRERIENLLPEACSQFFFFDGLEIKRYAQSFYNQQTQESIERTLGLPELRNLRDDAAKVVSLLDDKLSNLASDDKELQSLSNQIDDKQEEITTIEEQLLIYREDHQAALQTLESLQLEASQIEALESKMKEISRLEREASRLREDIDIREDQIEEALRQSPIPLLTGLIREVADEMQRSSVTEARRAGSASQLKSLLNAEVCFCGRSMDDHAREHIQREIEKSNLSGSAGIEAIRQDNLRLELENLANFKFPNLEDLCLDRDRLRDELEEVRQSIARLKGETGDLDLDRSKEVWRKVVEAEYIVKERKTAIERNSETLEQLQKEEEQLRRQREKYVSRQSESETLVRQSQLARGLHYAAKDLIEWRIEERKATIERITSQIHRSVTNKPDEYVGVVIKSDYSLGLKNAAGDVLNPETLSAGEKEALAFSFITGLNLASGTAAPFVMDTPFGHLDIAHQENLVASLPDLPSQVIVLATDRDFPPELLKNIRSEVAEILEIQRLSATEDASTVRAAA